MAQGAGRGHPRRPARHPHAEGLHEVGYVPVRATETGGDFLDGVSHVYHWHKEGFDLPRGAALLATGEVFPNQAFRYGQNVFGLQFHPEVSVPVITRWLNEASHMLERPNAHPRARQLADARRYDAPLETWLAGFLDRWLEPRDD